MKRIIKIISILSLTVFSFYYTKITINILKEKDPIMKKINKYEEKTKIVNGILKENTLLVGISGKKLDKEKSYTKLKSTNKFNKKLLEYQKLKPEINKKNNIDKLIKGKNTNNKEISFIFYVKDIEIYKEIIYILNKNNVNATFFIEKKLYNKEFKKYIGNNKIGLTSSLYKEKNNIKKELKNNYSNYCLYKNKKFLNKCKKNKINTIKPNKIEKNLYYEIKNNRKKGYIYEIIITRYNIKELNTSILYLKQKNYEIKDISKLLKE